VVGADLGWIKTSILKFIISFIIMSFIEVCAGCGGLSTGLISVKMIPIHISDIIKDCVNTLKQNHKDCPVFHKDMKELKLTEYHGKVDLLTGGVPCQAFSLAGVRKGLEDPRGQLIVEFNRLILECEPKVFMIENVKGLLSHNRGETFRDIVNLFSNNGKYNIFHKLLNAVDYEVPQKRERIFIIGTRIDLRGTFEFPEPSPVRKVLRDVLIDIPPSPGARYPEAKKAVLDLVPPGGCWVDLPEDIQREYMGEKSLAAGGGKRGMARRLSMNEPSLTLTTSPQQKQTERCHPLETRPLSVREYARIQSFPDTYEFCGSMASQYKQIGNAVPPDLAIAMGIQIVKFLRQC